MPQADYNEGVAEVTPRADVPNDYLSSSAATPAAFGGQLAEGAERLGQGALKASQFYGQAVANDANNQYQDFSNKLLYGDPNKMVTGPDGQQTPDTGYFGMKGADALHARKDVEQQLDDKIREIRENLWSPEQQLQFDGFSRRYRAMTAEKVGAFADQQAAVYATNTNRAQANLALDHISNNYDNPQEARAGFEDLTGAYVKNAQLAGAQPGDPQFQEAFEAAQRDGLQAQLNAMAVKDPARALDTLNLPKNRAIAGAKYAEMASSFGARADQQAGFSAADRKISDQKISGTVQGTEVAGVPGNFVQAVKQSEGFRSRAYWDVKQNTVGWGTRANSPDEVITPEEADNRFATEFSKAAKVVDEVNPNLDPGTRAALASLTFNAGADWTRSGLGDAVRAGDLAKAKEIFLQYNKAGGVTNDALAARRTREAAWFGQNDVAQGAGGSPAETLAHQEGELKLQVLNDPDMANRPLMQSAALNRLNIYFSAERQSQENDASAFKLRLANSTAEALDTGSVKNPLSADEFNAAYGADEGARQYREYEANVQLGADMRAVASMSPDQIATMQQRYQPQAGSDDYAAQTQRATELSKAVEANAREMKADPASFLIRRTDVGGEAWQRFSTIVQDRSKSPEEKQVAAGMFAEKMLAEQARLGVPEAERRVAPKSYTQGISDAMTGAATSDEAGARTGVIGMVKQDAALWGKHWPDVMREIAPGLQPVVRAIAAGADETAMQRLLSVDPKEKPSAVLKEQDAVKASELSTAVNTEMAPFLSTMVGRQRDRDYGSYLGLANELAALYVRDGQDAPTAAHNAFNALIGDRYEFRDTYRISKDPKLDANDIQQGAELLRGDLGKLGAKLPVDNIAGRSDTATAEDLAKIGRDGVWITSPRNDGLNMSYGDKWVKDGEGRPLFVPWAALADAARATQTPQAAAVLPQSYQAY